MSKENVGNTIASDVKQECPKNNRVKLNGYTGYSSYIYS